MNSEEYYDSMGKTMQGKLWNSADPSKPMSYQRASQVERYNRIKARLRGGNGAGRGDNPHGVQY